MRPIGSMHPTDGVPVFADTVASVIGSTAGKVVAQDWYSSTTPSSRPHIVTITANVACYFNDGSTKVTAPSTDSAGTTESSGRNLYIPANTPRTYQVLGDSTGYSMQFPTSGIAVLEFFRKH